MRIYQTIMGIVSVVAMGVIAHPLSAQTNGTTTGQTASQGVAIDGNNNTVYQTINQTTINRPDRGQIKDSFSQVESSSKNKKWENKREDKWEHREEKRERKEK